MEIFVKFQVDATTTEEAEKILLQNLQRALPSSNFTIMDQKSMWTEDGVLLDLEGKMRADWPNCDNDSCVIVVKNEHGDMVEQVSRDDFGVDGARWQELRDLMPDDALYFQPDHAGDDDWETSAADIKSYDVYRDYQNAVDNHPDCEILIFCGEDIQNPRFLDIKQRSPKLFWNDDEDEEQRRDEKNGLYPQHEDSAN